MLRIALFIVETLSNVLNFIKGELDSERVEKLKEASYRYKHAKTQADKLAALSLIRERLIRK